MIGAVRNILRLFVHPKLGSGRVAPLPAPRVRLVSAHDRSRHVPRDLLHVWHRWQSLTAREPKLTPTEHARRCEQELSTLKRQIAQLSGDIQRVQALPRYRP